MELVGVVWFEMALCAPFCLVAWFIGRSQRRDVAGIDVVDPTRGAEGRSGSTHDNHDGIERAVAERGAVEGRAVEVVAAQGGAGDAVSVDDAASLLPDRAEIGRRLAHCLRRRQSNRGTGLLVCAPDRLRTVEEALGYDVGDELVEAAMDRVAKVVAGGDFVGRIDRSTIVVIPAEILAERDLATLADRLIEGVSGPVTLTRGGVHDLGMSVGIASAFHRRPQVEEMIRDASLARRLAEDDGGGRHHISNRTDHGRARDRFELQRDLRMAAGERQFEVHYQPIVDLESGTTDWMEALLRWRHPRRGLLHPAKFLPWVGEAGVACELDRFVLNEACAQAARWSAGVGRPVRVSVNIDGRFLSGPDPALLVDQALQASGLTPDQLALEIDQIILERAGDEISGRLHRLLSVGVRLVVDNAQSVSPLMGPGSGQLAYKLDRSLVTSVWAEGGSEPERRKRGRFEGVQVVAQGLEGQEQVELYRNQGVRLGQGFWLQRPAQPDRLTALLSGGAEIQSPSVAGSSL